MKIIWELTSALTMTVVGCKPTPEVVLDRTTILHAQVCADKLWGKQRARPSYDGVRIIEEDGGFLTSPLLKAA